MSRAPRDLLLSGRVLARLAAFVVALAALQELGRRLEFAPADVPGYWPASGLAMGVLWRSDRRRRPVYLLALAATTAALAQAHGAGAGLAAGFAAAYAAEAWLGAALLRAVLGADPGPHVVTGPRRLIQGLLPAIVLACAAGAVAGTVALLLTGSTATRWTLLGAWFCADAFGALAMLPAVEAVRQWCLQWRGRSVRRPGTRVLAEALALLAVQGALCLVVLAPALAPVHPLQIAFPLMPGVFWSVVRFGPRGTAVQLLGVNTVTVWAAAHGRGVFVAEAGLGGPAARLLTVQALGVFLLVGSLVVADVVAARRAAEAAAHSRLLALENAVEGIAFIGTDGVIQRVNASFAQLVGRDRDDLVGSRWTTTLDQDDPGSAALAALDLGDIDPGGIDPDAPTRGPGVLARATVHVRGARGGTVPVEMTLVPESDSTGRAVGVHCFAHDVTERREAMDRVERLFRLSPELLCVLDEENRFCRLNPAWTNLLGHPVEALLGRSVLALVHPDDRALTAQHLQQVRAGEAMAVQNRYLAADGSFRWLHWNSAVDGDGALLYAVAHDISATKLTEQALAHARDQALEASRLKSQFLATMSHEIRTPMNGVIGLSDLLAETHLGRVQREYVEGIRTAGTALLTVINDILDFSKIEAGRLGLEEADFDLATLVRGVVALVEGAAHAKDLPIHMDLDPNLPGVLRGDPARIRQVLLNLVGNAVKFTATGSVTVRLDLMPAAESGLAALDQAAGRGDEVPHAVRIEVVDTGIGMDAATLARLFQPFTQADASTTRVYGGTGLGLAISRELVEAMGGWITVQSAPGAGTTFRVGLALPGGAEPPSRSVDGPGTDRAPGSGARVLVVEDNEINRKVAVGLLGRSGHIVDVAADGVEALELASRGTYELILMDCQMPRMDGYTATRLLRERPETAQVPIIAMTAGALPEDRQRCLAIGMNDYLCKPIRSRELDRVVRRWVTRTAIPAQRRPRPPGRPAEPPGSVRARLQELTGPGSDIEVDLVRGIAASFLDRSGHLLASLHSALSAGQTELARRSAHSLRGAAANVGAATLAEACARVELLVDAGDLRTAEDDAWALDADLDRAVAEIRAYLA